MLTKEQAIDFLREYLAAHNMTQAEAARLLGYSRASISLWISGKTTPSYFAIMKMLEKFGG